MKFKNLLKKSALIAGGVALLAAGGGAINANADADGYNIKETPAMSHADLTNGHFIGTDPTGEAGPSSVAQDPNQERASIYTYKGHRYEAPDNGDLVKDLGPVSASDSDSNVASIKGARGEINGNTNNGKLVQTGEPSNSAKDADIMGAAFAISSLGFAEFDLSKHNW